MSLLIVGCGYVGQAVVRALQSAAEPKRIFALTRSAQRCQELRELGTEPIVGNWLEPGLKLPPVEQVLIAVPHRPDEAWGANTHLHGLQQLRTSLGCQPRRLVYLSTTGVYGSNPLGQIDETSPVAPTRIGPQIAVAAENALSSLYTSAIVLRLAGIYGPGRIPLAGSLRAGQPLAVQRSGHLNLVHVADIARVICLLLERHMARSLYVLSDGQPVQREVFYRELARCCGVAEPRFEEPEAESSRRQRAGDKRVDPSRIVHELRYEFLFPDYRSGLADALRDE